MAKAKRGTPRGRKGQAIGGVKMPVVGPNRSHMSPSAMKQMMNRSGLK